MRLASAAAGIAITAAALTACSASAAPVSCASQYQAWRHSAGQSSGRRELKADLGKLRAAGSSDNILAIRSALIRLGADAGKLGRPPMPACADPHHYWPAILARFRAAGANARAGSGLGSLMLAAVPLKAVRGLERKLTAELKATGAR